MARVKCFWLIVFCFSTSCVNNTVNVEPPLLGMREDTPDWPDLSFKKRLPEKPKPKNKSESFLPPSQKMLPDFEMLLEKINSMSREEFDLWLFNHYPLHKIWLDERGFDFLKENFDIDDPFDPKYKT